METTITSLQNLSPESQEVLNSTGIGLLLVMAAEGIPNFIQATYESNGKVYDLTFKKRELEPPKTS